MFSLLSSVNFVVSVKRNQRVDVVNKRHAEDRRKGHTGVIRARNDSYVHEGYISKDNLQLRKLFMEMMLHRARGGWQGCWGYGESAFFENPYYLHLIGHSDFCARKPRLFSGNNEPT